MKDEEGGTNLGMVTSRKCPHCGQSEIGYTTPDGAFHPLEPGTLIHVVQVPEGLSSDTGVRPVIDDFAAEEEAMEGEFRPWVPTALRGDKRLRVKYGVLVSDKVALRGVTGNDYRSAFLRKIEKLIEKEVLTPLPVILDRFFAAPHLASGNPRQVSQAMWRELEEIRKPVLFVSQWIERQNQETLSGVIHPRSIEELGGEPVNDSDLEAELESLALEEFLEML